VKIEPYLNEEYSRVMKKLLLLLLLSLGLIGISYADDSHEDELAAELARQAAKSAAQEMMAEIIAEVERAKKLAEFQRKLEAEKSVGDPGPTKFLKKLWVEDIATKVKSYWNYQGAEVGWGCEVYVLQDRDGTVEAVNIQNCSTGNSDNALMADDKARSFKNSIERAVYKASPLPTAPDDAVFDREILFLFRAD